MDNTLLLLDHALADLTRLREELSVRQNPPPVAGEPRGLLGFLALGPEVSASWTSSDSAVEAIRKDRE